MKKLLAIITLVALASVSIGAPLFAIVWTDDVQAAEDQFTIGQTVTGDDVAPSVPTNLSATAVSQTQIDLSWTASTDDLAVTGYQVFRDLAFIATSTAISYSDTGLTPDTTYSYTVTAFDAAVNISGHSATATATTFSPSSTNGGGSAPLELRYISVSPDLQSALIQFGTNVPVQAFVYWGETLDYELGSIASPLYLSDHSVALPGLSPGTRYFFRIDLVDGYERRLVLEGQEFRTLSLPDIFPPANVSNFIATPSETDITLTWENPKADFEAVRIVKSDKFYPRDPTEGEIIYEGRAERYVDGKVVRDKTYYYTAFSRDRIGNYSSGAVTDARLLRPGELPTRPKLFAGILQLPKELIHSLLRAFSLKDVDFIQDGKKLPVVSNTVEIRGDRNLLISIDYEKVPEILKTVVVTMFDPDDRAKTFSFLLRINADKTAYQAHVAALERPGKYEFSLAILDHKHQGLALLAGIIVSRVPDFVSGKGGNPFGDINIGSLQLLLSILALLVLICAMFIVLKKSSRKRKRKGEISTKTPNMPSGAISSAIPELRSFSSKN